MSPYDVTEPVTPNNTENKQSSLCENKYKPTYVKDEKNNDDLPEDSQKENTSTITAQQLDRSFLPESVHKEFVQVAKPFLSAVEIFNLWKRVLIVYNKIKLERPMDDVIEAVINAFKQTVFMKKMERIHSTFEGYFYRVVYGMLIVEKRRENKHLLFDFIGD